MKIKNSEETACQKVVAMVTANLMDKHLLSQIVAKKIRKNHQVWWVKLAYEESYKPPKSVRAQSTPPPPRSE